MAKAKKSAVPEGGKWDALEFPNSQADQLFREDPCARLLLLCYFEALAAEREPLFYRGKQGKDGELIALSPHPQAQADMDILNLAMRARGEERRLHAEHAVEHHERLKRARAQPQKNWEGEEAHHRRNALQHATKWRYMIEHPGGEAGEIPAEMPWVRLEELARRWAPKKASAFIKALQDESEAWGAAERALMNSPSSEALLDSGGISIQALRASSYFIETIMKRLRESAHAEMCIPHIPDEKLPEALRLGREALAGKSELSQKTLDAIERDPELSLALTRALFRGPRELACIDQGVMNFLADPEEGGGSAGLIRIAETIRPTHPHAGALIAPERQPLHAFDTLKKLGSILDAPEAFAPIAREALLRLTDTRPQSSWETLHPAGDWRLYDPREPATDARRPAGSPMRGELLRTALRELCSIAEWALPLDCLAASEKSPLGPKALATINTEASAHERLARAAIACALRETALKPTERSQIASAFAARAARGFGELPESPEPEQLLPGWQQRREELDAQEALKNAASGSGPRVNTKAFRDSLPKEVAADPMIMLSLQAAHTLRLPLEAPQGIVGQAKQALASSAGLSNGAWRAMCANPELAEAFSELLRSKIVAQEKSAPRKPATLQAAERIMAQADESGERFSVNFRRLHERENESLLPEAAGRALSACAMANIGAPAQERMLRFLSQNALALSLTAGRLPCLPTTPHRRHYQADPSIFNLASPHIQGLVEDQRALFDLGPSLVKRMSERLERAVASGIKRGEAADVAQMGAFTELNERFSDILDCAREQPVGFWTGLDRKEPLASALRQHEVWSAQQRERQAQSNPNLRASWEPEAPALGAHHGIISGRLMARELLSGMELFDEGKRMTHCVASYASHCINGSSRILSVSLNGVRKSTLELAPHSRKGERMSLNLSDPAARDKVAEWKPVQNRGPHNHTINDAELLRGSKEIALAYTASFLARTALIRERLAQEALEKSTARAKAAAP